MGIRKKIIFNLRCLRLIPHLIFFNTVKNKADIHYETNRWLHILGMNMGLQKGFLKLMVNYPEFRNLFYYRIGRYANLISFLYTRMNTLFIVTPNIGKGLFIQHGFSTIIVAKEIGENCWINQQVTLGYTNATDSPIIKDNVMITAGAKVLGKCTVGKNSIIGANAVVVKDVPENCTVVGVPAYIVKRDGVKVKEYL